MRSFVGCVALHICFFSPFLHFSLSQYSVVLYARDCSCRMVSLTVGPSFPISPFMPSSPSRPGVPGGPWINTHTHTHTISMNSAQICIRRRETKDADHFSFWAPQSVAAWNTIISIQTIVTIHTLHKDTHRRNAYNIRVVIIACEVSFEISFKSLLYVQCVVYTCTYSQ